MSEQSTETEAIDAISTPEEGKGSKKLIIIVLAVVILLGGGGGAAFFFTRSSGAETGETAKEKKTKAKSEDEETLSADEEATPKKSTKSGRSLKSVLPEDEDVTQIVELQPFIVNLADTEQARYLRLSVSLGVASEGKEEAPPALFITRVRNAMLAILSDKNSSEILSLEGKAKLRKDLLRAAQAAADEPEIHAIYITDFIVQL
jgi:flagellar FliL protein